MTMNDLHSISEQKLHYKMYKAGKRWLFAGVMFLGTGIAVATGGNLVSADTEPVFAPQTTTEAAASETSDVTTSSTVPLTSSVDKAATTTDQTTTHNSDAAKPTTDTTMPAKTQSESSLGETVPTTTEATKENTNASDNTPAPTQSDTTADTTTTETSSNDQTKTPATSTDNDQAAKVTALGDATTADIDAAKEKATAAYEQTGQAQVITAVSDEPASAEAVIQQQAADALPTVDAAIKQAMTDNGITLDKVTQSGNEYYYWGTNPNVEVTTDPTHGTYNPKAQAEGSTARDGDLRSVIAETQLLTDPTHALQELADGGIKVSVLLQNSGADYSGLQISASYQMAPKSSQTITFINDSANGAVLHIQVTPELQDDTQMVNDEIANLKAQGYILVSNDYQKPAATMTSEQALNTIEAKLKEDIQQYNQANGTDYVFESVSTAYSDSKNVPGEEHRFLLSSEKLGHEAWDQDISRYITSELSYRTVDHASWASNRGATIDMNVATNPGGSRYSYHDNFDLDAQINQDWIGGPYDNARDNKYFEIQPQAFNQMIKDTGSLVDSLRNDSSLRDAFEVLRTTNQTISVLAAPSYTDSTQKYTYNEVETEWDNAANKQTYKIVATHELTLNITGLTADSSKSFAQGVQMLPMTVPADTNFEVHFVKAGLSPDSPQIKTQIPEGASVTPNDYYNNLVPDGPSTTPDTPDVPNVPDTPDTPDVPDTPDLPSTFGDDTPSTNDSNHTPGLPATGGTLSNQQGKTKTVAMTNSRQRNVQKANKSSLPQTGETVNTTLTVIGGALALAIGILGLAGLRKRS